MLLRYTFKKKPMKKILFPPVLLLIFLMFSSFAKHKFYVSIFQIEQNIPKKRLEVTCRIFIDDLNKTLSENSNQKTAVGEPTESIKDVEILKNYLIENIKIKVNNQDKTLVYKSKEIETNVVVCYFVCENVPKIKSFSIKNTAMLTLNKEQQNIVQLKINNQKNSMLLTNDNFVGLLNY